MRKTTLIDGTKRLKVDTSKNGRDTDILVDIQKEKDKKKLKMRITDKIIILVDEKNYNEEYRKYWMKRHNISDDGCQKIIKPNNFNAKAKSNIDMGVVKKMLKEGYTIPEISREIGISRAVIYKHLRAAQVYMPTLKERIFLFKKKGFTIEKIASITKMSVNTIKKHY